MAEAKIEVALTLTSPCQFLFVAVEQSRGANIGTSLRCAVAFGADAFVIVGSSKFATHGAHGKVGEMNKTRFWQGVGVLILKYIRHYSLAIFIQALNHTYLSFIFTFGKSS